MNYNHLYYFYVTARAGSVTEGAAILRIAQPSLSGQIKALESTVNRSLFRRVGRRIVLTSEGEFFFEHCRRIFEPGEELSKSIVSQAGPNPRLHLGICDEVERPFVVDVVGGLFKRSVKKRTPHFTMTSESHSSLMAQLKNRTLDAVITNYPTFEDGVQVLAEYGMPVVLVSHPDDPVSSYLPMKEKIDLGKISRQHPIQWVLPHRKLRLRTEAATYMEKQKIKGHVALESDVMGSLVRAVVDGIGMGFLPLPYVRPFIKQERLKIHGPKAGFWTHRLWLMANPVSSSNELTLELKASFENKMTGTTKK
jgi:LysR family transcriptional activator of nhaA